MIKLKKYFADILKFNIWFGLGLAVFLAVAAVGLPVGLIVSEYYGNASFPIGFTVSSSILALICLAIFARSLRQIQANSDKPKTKRTRLNPEPQEKHHQADYRQKRRKLEPRTETVNLNYNNLAAAYRANGSGIGYGNIENRQRRKL